jgi:hypothetical protein
MIPELRESQRRPCHHYLGEAAATGTFGLSFGSTIASAYYLGVSLITGGFGCLTIGSVCAVYWANRYRVLRPVTEKAYVRQSSDISLSKTPRQAQLKNAQNESSQGEIETRKELCLSMEQLLLDAERMQFESTKTKQIQKETEMRDEIEREGKKIEQMEFGLKRAYQQVVALREQNTQFQRSLGEWGIDLGPIQDSTSIGPAEVEEQTIGGLENRIENLQKNNAQIFLGLYEHIQKREKQES